MSKQAEIIDKMRKGRKTGAAAFIESMTEQVQENKAITEHEREDITVPESESVTEVETESVNVHEQESEQITEQFIQHINEQEYEPEQQTISIIEKYNNKKTKEETFTRQTYMIRNDLIKRLHNAAKGRGKGFKTDVINDILERFLNDNKL